MVYINTLGFGYFGNFAKPQKGELKAGNVTRKDLPGNSLDLWTLTFMFSISSEPSPFLICIVPQGEEKHKNKSILY